MGEMDRKTTSKTRHCWISHIFFLNVGCFTMVSMCMTTALYLRFCCGMFELELLGSRRSLDDGSQWSVKWVMGYINEVHDRLTFH